MVKYVHFVDMFLNILKNTADRRENRNTLLVQCFNLPFLHTDKSSNQNMTMERTNNLIENRQSIWLDDLQKKI